MSLTKNLLMIFINHSSNFEFNQFVSFSKSLMKILKSTYLAKRFDLIIMLILLKMNVIFEEESSIKFLKELIKTLKFFSLTNYFFKM